MSGAFEIGALGLRAQQRALDGIASNIANVNTIAFKRSEPRFADFVAARVDADAPQRMLQAPDAAGVTVDAQFMLNEPGEIVRTGRAMDVAVEGRGFIELMGPDGQTLLWRGGALRVNADGMLAGAGGQALRAAISVPIDAEAIEIAPDGKVRARTGGDPEPVEIGQIALVRIDDSAAVDRLDGGLYRLREGAVVIEALPGEDGTGMLVQGATERSNVALADEMVQLMLVQRAYSANAQILQAADQLMAIANGLRR